MPFAALILASSVACLRSPGGCGWFCAHFVNLDPGPKAVRPGAAMDLPFSVIRSFAQGAMLPRSKTGGHTLIAEGNVSFGLEPRMGFDGGHASPLSPPMRRAISAVVEEPRS